MFLDASALVPLVLVRDQWHPAVTRLMAGLRRAGRPSFVTSNWTLYEALAITARRGHPFAVSLHRFVSQHSAAAPVSRAVEQQALDRFLTWTDKGASVVDHANLLLASELGCEAVISFDDDFVPLVGGTGMRLLGR